MEDALVWVFRFVVVLFLLGFTTWALKGWWEERNKKHSVKDESPTWAELSVWFEKEKSNLVTQKDLYELMDTIGKNCRACIKECNQRRNDERDREMAKFAELFNKQLEHGEKRFQSMEQEQTKTREVLGEISQNLALLTQTVKEALKSGAIGITQVPK